MSIVIEPTEEFIRLSDYHRDIAAKHMLNKEFNSLDEAFNQIDNRGFHLWQNFYVIEKEVKPKQLPLVIKEAYIACRYSREAEPTSYIEEITGLVARLKDH